MWAGAEQLCAQAEATHAQRMSLLSPLQWEEKVFPGSAAVLPEGTPAHEMYSPTGTLTGVALRGPEY